MSNAPDPQSPDPRSPDPQSPDPQSPDPKSPAVRPLFWKHRHAYMLLKVGMLAVGLYLAFRLFS